MLLVVGRHDDATSPSMALTGVGNTEVHLSPDSVSSQGHFTLPAGATVWLRSDQTATEKRREAWGKGIERDIVLGEQYQVGSRGPNKRGVWGF